MSETARNILIAILLFGTAGTATELLLLAHTEDANQWIPLVLCAATVVLGIGVAIRPTRASIRVFQVVMLLMIVGGGLGMYLHLRANMEFQLEMDAALTGFALLKKSVVAKSPPALAPGSMAQLGLIGLAFTYKHPKLER